MLRRLPILFVGVGLGATAMYLLDPQRGRRRRHVLEDRMRGAVHDVEDVADKAKRDLENRAHGLAARARGSRPTRRPVRGALSPGMPVRKVLEGGAGALLALLGISRGGIIGFGSAIAGVSLMACAAVDRQNGIIRVQKTMTLDAPIERVFDLFARPENFPRSMDHVIEVHSHGNRSHWRVAGPAHIPIEWDAEIVEATPPRKLAWRSLPGSPVAHHGEIHFETADDHATRVSIHMAYAPPAGALGHAIAIALRGDPKTLLDADLLELKSQLERDNAAPEAVH